MAASKAEGDGRNVQAVLAKSAQGATFLVVLQIGSRALTFIVNQILLRYLSPDLLGISSQLELFSISVLYFARESIRVALQRHGEGPVQRDGAGTQSPSKGNEKRITDAYDHERRAQEAVNMSYIAVALGPLLALILAKLYLDKAGPVVLAVPYIRQSLYLYALAAVVELCIEPCFVIAQQRMLYGLRASSEATATLVRCFVTCGTAIWASKNNRPLGALPFSLGQLSFAVTLNLVYYSRISAQNPDRGFYLIPRALKSIKAPYLLSRFSQPILAVALNLYAQSVFKHLLTQGDALLIALFTTLSSQGVYALASNYGSLLARMLFQPIEESSRSLFGRLLSADKSAESSRSAYTYLTNALRLYALLSAVIVFLGPALAPLLLTRIAGPAWSNTSAPKVLSVYCYYIPLLAINGILEAFVSAVSTPSQLQVQSAWMLGFSAGFAATGYLLLSVYDLGAKGLVAANAVNMAMRIVWSWSFVRQFFREKGISLSIRQPLPRLLTIASGTLVAILLDGWRRNSRGTFMELLQVLVISGVYGVLLLLLERQFLMECYRTFRPSSTVASNDRLADKTE